MKYTFEQQLLLQSSDMLQSCKSYVNPLLQDRIDILLNEINYYIWSLSYEEDKANYDPGQDYIP